MTPDFRDQPGPSRDALALRDTTDRQAWLVLAAAAGVGPRTAGALIRAAGSVQAAARAPVRALAALAGVGASRAERLARALSEADPAALEAAASAAGQAVVTPADEAYPPSLMASPDAPCALFVRGTLPAPDAVLVAVVGTRGASTYGIRVARALAEGLARAGVVVVSGLARGIDGAAHEAALGGGGQTVAVLGNGADVAYPPEPAGLAAQIPKAGALVTEHPPGTPPHPGHFPRRNRIVAGLSRAVVVVEAPEASGALGTARLAAEAGREVLAVPGPVDRGNHAGCHRLIRDGAFLGEGLGDVLRALGIERAPGPAPSAPARALPPAPGPALVVWTALDPDEALDADEIARRTGLSLEAVASGLTALEIDGRVVRVPGVGMLRA